MDIDKRVNIFVTKLLLAFSAVLFLGVVSLLLMLKLIGVW